MARRWFDHAMTSVDGSAHRHPMQYVEKIDPTPEEQAHIKLGFALWEYGVVMHGDDFMSAAAVMISEQIDKTATDST